MNMSPHLAAFLREAGLDAVHWVDVGDVAAPDHAIAAFAAAAGMTVVTHDLDFGAPLATGGRSAPSVIQIREDDLSVAQIGGQLLALIGDIADQLEAGALVTLDSTGIRLRALPLRRQ
jgi:predicted nuclease of predicted toxin-antitoxin system